MIYKSYIVGIIYFSIAAIGFSQSNLQYSSFADLRSSVASDKVHITVLNFWATWCRPCVAELPDFEKIHSEFNSKNVNVVLANLDFHSQADTILPAFIQKNKLSSKVVHITDQDPNDWINSFWHDWSGTIPVTAIYVNGEKIWFIDGPTDYETLKSVIIKYIK